VEGLSAYTKFFISYNIDNLLCVEGRDDFGIINPKKIVISNKIGKQQIAVNSPFISHLLGNENGFSIGFKYILLIF
jgi:hypothetical protein